MKKLIFAIIGALATTGCASIYQKIDACPDSVSKDQYLANDRGCYDHGEE